MSNLHYCSQIVLNFNITPKNISLLNSWYINNYLSYLSFRYDSYNCLFIKKSFVIIFKKSAFYTLERRSLKKKCLLIDKKQRVWRNQRPLLFIFFCFVRSNFLWLSAVSLLLVINRCQNVRHKTVEPLLKQLDKWSNKLCETQS